MHAANHALDFHTDMVIEEMPRIDSDQYWVMDLEFVLAYAE
jgi:hypothetical protein